MQLVRQLEDPQLRSTLYDVMKRNRRYITIYEQVIYCLGNNKNPEEQTKFDYEEYGETVMDDDDEDVANDDYNCSKKIIPLRRVECTRYRNNRKYQVSNSTTANTLGEFGERRNVSINFPGDPETVQLLDVSFIVVGKAAQVHKYFYHHFNVENNVGKRS